MLLVCFHCCKKPPELMRSSNTSWVDRKWDYLFPKIRSWSLSCFLVKFHFLRRYITRAEWKFHIYFIFQGISCPRAGTISGNKTGRNLQADPFGDEALNFTKEKILQRMVRIPPLFPLPKNIAKILCSFLPFRLKSKSKRWTNSETWSVRYPLEIPTWRWLWSKKG